MIAEIKVPSPGESITEVEIGVWLVEDGALVNKDQEIAEIESDKATLTISASESGKISIKAQEGETVEVGAVVCTIDTSARADEKVEPDNEKDTSESKEEQEAEAEDKVEKADVEDEKPLQPESQKQEQKSGEPSEEYDKVKVTAVAREMMKEHGLSVDDIIKGLQRIGKKEVEAVVHSPKEKQAPAEYMQKEMSRELDRQRMSSLRRKLSERLVAVKNETAMLTTFNEIDMTAVMELRKKHQLQFTEKHGLKLGFMSFFTKAVAMAMSYHPMVNAQMDGEEIIMPQFVDVGIAVSTPKGLMVPIIRNAESKSIPQIEIEIRELADKARNKKISVDELTGGTFTITNGGIFGSLLSTPILNPPQSAILGMHNIQERPVAMNGQVVVRPMMYVALSYDHRIIDGKDSVGFLVKVKELLENPQQLYTRGKDLGELLLDI